MEKRGDEEVRHADEPEQLTAFERLEAVDAVERLNRTLRTRRFIGFVARSKARAARCEGQTAHLSLQDEFWSRWEDSPERKQWRADGRLAGPKVNSRAWRLAARDLCKAFVRWQGCQTDLGSRLPTQGAIGQACDVRSNAAVHARPALAPALFATGAPALQVGGDTGATPVLLNECREASV